MAGSKSSNSHKEEKSSAKSSSKSSSKSSKSKSKSSSSKTNISKGLQGTEKQEDYYEQQEYSEQEEPVGPDPDPNPYPPSPPTNPQSTSSGFSMQTPRQEQSRVPDYITSSKTSSTFGSTYGAVAKSAYQYPPTDEVEYPTTSDSTSRNTAPSSQEQHSYSPLYPSYETPDSSGPKETSNWRR